MPLYLRDSRQLKYGLSGCDQRLFHQQRMAHTELVRCQGGGALSWEHWGAIEWVTAEGWHDQACMWQSALWEEWGRRPAGGRDRSIPGEGHGV